MDGLMAMTGYNLDVLPRRHFACVYADPPWHFRVRSEKGTGRSASNHYDTQDIESLKLLPIKDIAADDCHLFMWATTAMLPEALELLSCWGFNYAGNGFCWVKTNPRERNGALFLDDFHSFHVGLGFTTRKNVELCLLGRRGHPKRLRKDIRELIVAPRREHSRKPEEAIERIEQYCPGPYLELFARSTRPDWISWGQEVGKFDAPYDPVTDVEGSFNDAYAAIRERQARGGTSWTPK